MLNHSRVIFDGFHLATTTTYNVELGKVIRSIHRVGIHRSMMMSEGFKRSMEIVGHNVDSIQIPNQNNQQSVPTLSDTLTPSRTGGSS